MKHIIHRVSLWGAVCLLLVQGCVRQPTPEEVASRVEVMQSRPMQMGALEGVKPVVAVVVRDNARVAALHQLMDQALLARGYEVTENPSLAGYVLQVNVIFAGSMDAASARANVPQGYGYKLSPGGEGAHVFVADVLLAARVQPDMKGRQKLVIASTATSKSVRDDEEMRVMALLEGKNINEDAAFLELEKAVVRVVAKALPPLRR